MNISDDNYISWVDRTKLKAEYYLEIHNGKIQGIMLVLLFGLGGVFGVSTDYQLGIIASLLVWLGIELFILSVKDSIAQKKLNKLYARKRIEEGAVFRIADFNLNRFYKATTKQFFISGIALSAFFENSKDKVEQLLKSGKEVDVLIADPKTVVDNTKLYYGIGAENRSFRNKVYDIYSKQGITLNRISEIEEFEGYINSGLFKLRVAQSVFSTSFVGNDIFGFDNEEKEIKASFYQYKCTASSNEPNILINSELNKDWYIFFKKTIQAQWNDSKEVRSKGDFDNLYRRIQELASQYRSEE